MTYTHLTIGTPKIPAKPPRAQPPCTEPYVTGTNILKDPGFELQLSNYGGGPNSDEIPEFDTATNTGTRWSDGSSASSLGWRADRDDLPPASERRFWIETANPRTGTYHVRTGEPSFGSSVTPPNIVGDALWVSEFVDCTDFYWYAARISSGDFIRVSAYAMASTTTGSPHLWVGCYSYNAVQDTITFDVSTGFPVTTAYAQYEVSTFAPTDSTFLAVYFGWEGTSSIPSGIVADIDDVVLEVQD